jgi:hypothetical protein
MEKYFRAQFYVLILRNGSIKLNETCLEPLCDASFIPYSLIKVNLMLKYLVFYDSAVFKLEFKRQYQTHEA